MTYPLRPFYYTQRFCVTAIFTVIATGIVFSTSGIGPFHSQSQLHAAKSDVQSSVTKDEVTKDKTATATDKKTETAKTEETKTEGKTPEKAAEKTDDKAAKVEAAESGDKNRIRNINFDHIKFEMQKGDNFERKMLTPAIEKLHGKRVRIGGYILPSGNTEIVDGFFLTRDNGECCFGPGAIIYDRIWVELKPDVVLKYVTKSVSVTGQFEIKYLKDPVDDSYMAVYQLSGVEVK